MVIITIVMEYIHTFVIITNQVVKTITLSLVDRIEAMT